MVKPGEPLSGREREVIGLAATGATNRMIAQELCISPNTVKVHLRNIFIKLETSSRTEASVIAIREGWVEAPGGKQTVDEPVEPEAPAELDADEPAEPEAPAELDVEPEEEELVVPPRPPLPWVKRIYLAASVLFVIVVTVFTWPGAQAHAVPAGSCDNEFTAGCAAEENGLALSEPESLWVSGAPIPRPHGRFALVALNGRLYLIGGETPDGVVGEVLVYYVPEDGWETAAEKPSPAANLAAVVLDERIYAPGGSDRQGKPLDTLEIYDPARDSWSEGAPMPAPLTAHAVAAWGGKVYIFGGWNGLSYTGDALVYDPAVDRWETLASMTTPRGFAGAAVVHDEIMVVGGYDGQREYAVCEKFNPQAGEWKVCPPMSTPRGGIGVATVAGQVYIIGGGWESFVTFSERYNPHADDWRNVETPLLLAGGEWRNLGVAAVGTRVYALGGWQRGRYLNLNQAYETLPNRLYLPATSSQPSAGE